MTTIADEHRPEDTVVTSQALELMDCFEGGVADVVFRLAEEFARRRTENDDRSALVEVTAADVRQAGERIIAALRGLASEGRMPPELVVRIDQMSQCFQCHEP